MFKSNGWKVASLLFVVVMLDNLCTLTIGVNLFTYAFNKMHFSLSSSANIVTNFMGTLFFLALAGGVVSDLWLSRFITIVIGVVLECLGLLLLTLSASLLTPPDCPLLSASCHPATGSQKAVLFGGLYLLALGSGGLKANLAPMGAEQFGPDEKKELGTYFNTYFFSMCIGSLGALTGMVYIQENVSFKVGYGTALGCMIVAFPVMVSGYPWYRHEPRGSSSSPLVCFARVFVAAFRNRRLPTVPPELLHKYDECRASGIKHTNQFKWLDKAATTAIVTSCSRRENRDSSNSPWELCSVMEVEELKVVLRILPIFASTIVINCLIAQVQTISVQQGRTMDRRVVNDFEIPPASLSALPVIFMLIALPIYDKFIVPVLKGITGHENGITYLQRIGLGLVLATLSMVVAILVEMKRLHVARKHNLLDNPEATVPLKFYWMLLQYVILGIADMFTFVGLMEFFYRESPERIKSMANSLSFVSLAVGYFLSSALVSIVDRITTRNGKLGWLPNNINRGKITNFYLLLTIISVGNFIIFLVCANWYRYRDEDGAEKLTNESDV